MPLSEHEQRLLDQIERALYAEDPKFASTVRGGRLRRPSRRRRIQGVVLFFVGVVALVMGLVFIQALSPGGFPVVSVIGFLMMFAGAVLAITATGKKGEAAAGEGDGKGAAAGDKDKSRFTTKMEERFRKRFEQE
ncbi:DUF3040 domain-containing protein [Actinomycetospora chiangmaiensis]|uniref:DUF3040 domain-containing protein n=1 Tax=Actinomycetospora chiangmaiensis TaxID=402650 RepID=UPI000372E8BB|nr:DUF3040 domain-containing protein [Actinomycetospora chiangmaiensis]